MKNKKTIIYALSILSFIFLVGGVSYAYFVYDQGVVNVTLETGQMSVKVTNKNNLSLSNNVPISNTEGKALSNYIDFTVTGVTDTEAIYYEVDIVPKEGNTLDPKYVKTYLTDQSNNQLHGVSPYTLMQDSKYNFGKMIYANVILNNTDGSSKTTTKDFRLRFWIDEKYDSNGAETFNFDVYVYSQNVKPNLMNVFPSTITTHKADIKSVVFKSEPQSDIDTKCTQAASNGGVCEDITYQNRGNVKAWLDLDSNDSKYTLYVESEGTTYLTTGVQDEADSYENAIGLFHGFTSLTELTFSNIDTTLVTNMTRMFRECSSLTEIDLRSFNTINVTTLQQFLSYETLLTNVNISSFDTSNVENMYATFVSLPSILRLDLSNINTSSATTMRSMFNECTNLVNLDLSHFETENVESMFSMFLKCKSLVSLDLSNFNTSKVTDMYRMFRECSSLTSLNVSSFDTRNVENMGQMFLTCSSLPVLDISNFVTSKVTTMENMFQACSLLTSISLTNFDTSLVTNMYAMFYDCVALKTIDLSSFNTKKVTNMQVMFRGCTSLTTIYVNESKWSTAAVTESTNMFNLDTALVGGNGTAYTTSYRDKTYARVDKAGQAGYLTSKESNYVYSNITYDYNHGTYTYPEGINMNTNYFVDYGKDFEIEMVVRVSSLGNRVLIIGNYQSGVNSLNVEVNASNQLRMYLIKAEAAKGGTIAANEDITIIFNWFASSKYWRITAKGTTTDITLTGTSTMPDEVSLNSLVVGAKDNRTATNLFKQVIVKSLKITEKRVAGRELGSLPVPVKPGATFKGWTTTLNGSNQVSAETLVPNNDTTYYAHW